MTIKLKPLIHYPDSNSVEATWVSQTVIPAVGTEGEEGYVPASVVETQVRCHSYADVQMDMLRADLGEGDYLLYQDLIATVTANIQPAAPEPFVPLQCDALQFRKALTRWNLRPQVEAWVAASDDLDLKDDWEFSTVFIEDNRFVVAAALALGKTPAEIRAFFELAITL